MTNAPDLSHRTVIEKRVGAVALITLNRPERLNAWTDEMRERYLKRVTLSR
jgi:enoyl-CoA hydratase/carnithine racemase